MTTTKRLTHGRKTYEEGFNMKTYVQKMLKRLGVEAKLRHYVEDPYQKNRFKPEYVGQCVWIYPYKTVGGIRLKEHCGILLRQEDLEAEAERDKWRFLWYNVSEYSCMPSTMGYKLPNGLEEEMVCADGRLWGNKLPYTDRMPR